jgi:hypothetical protein
MTNPERADLLHALAQVEALYAGGGDVVIETAPWSSEWPDAWRVQLRTVDREVDEIAPTLAAALEQAVARVEEE